MEKKPGTQKRLVLSHLPLKKWWMIIVIFVLLSGSSWGEDRRIDKSKLVIMTLNAEFLWDGVAPEEGQADFPWKFSQIEAEEHMQEIAQIIIQNNPDIVNLVEVENLNALTTFNNNFLDGRGYRPYLSNGKDTYTGQDMALLTRIDPEGNAIERDDRNGQSGSVRKSVSKNYYTTISLGNNKLFIIGLHLLARPLQEDRRLAREAQADAIRSIALEKQCQNCSLVIMGDFNDYDGEEKSRDHIDSMPITNVLRMIREMNPNKNEDDLINAASFMPKANRYTAFYDANDNGDIDQSRELTSIDHILLSPELAAKVDLVEMPHNYNPTEITDHFPIVVHFKLGGAPITSIAQIRITSLLPNPPGDENQNEEATLKNFGNQPVKPTGWKLRDLSGRTWSLDGLGTLQPGDEKTIKRRNQPMAMNNSGDTIDLVNPAGEVVQTVTYSQAEEGETVTPGN